jgi:hypothetical protein
MRLDGDRIFQQDPGRPISDVLARHGANSELRLSSQRIIPGSAPGQSELTVVSAIVLPILCLIVYTIAFMLVRAMYRYCVRRGRRKAAAIELDKMETGGMR